MKFNIPPATRGCIGLTIFFTSLYAFAKWQQKPVSGTADSKVPFLTLVPAQCYRYPWTIITSTFVEQNVLNLLINTTAVFLSGRYLERAWSSKDFAIVVIIASALPNILLVPTYIIWGAILGNDARARTPIAGAITLQAAFLVCFKQLVPEHTVSLYKGLIKIRVKHFPAIFLALNTFGGIVLGTDTALLLAWYGLITTYLYLRFFRHQQEIGSGISTRGDASETFAFATFFPSVIQPPIAAFADQIYTLCCKLKLIRPFSDEAVVSSNELVASRGEATLPTTTNQAYSAAERRRQLALKALDDRLTTASDQNESQTDAKPSPLIHDQTTRLSE